MSLLTVDIHIATDVCVAQGVGHFTGDGFSEERVVDDDFIGVSRYLFDYIASFGPPLNRSERNIEWQSRQETRNLKLCSPRGMKLVGLTDYISESSWQEVRLVG